jgi:hypothetical protein
MRYGLVLLGLSGPALIAPVLAQESIWKWFTAPQLGFSVVMPGKPTETKGKNLTLYEVTRDAERVRYAVGVIELAIAPGNDAQLLNQIYDGIRSGVEKEDGTLVSSRPIRLAAQYPGQEMNFILPDHLQARWRIYVVGKRAYFMSVTTTPDNMNLRLAKSVAVFLNSLKVPAPKP